MAYNKQPDTAGTGPASSAHQQMWFLEQVGDAGRAYRSNTLIHLHGNLDAQALRVALSALVERHDALRMKLVSAGDGIERRVVPAQPVNLEIVDLAHVPEDDRAAALTGAVASEAAFRFDLRRPPLIRWVLFRLAPAYNVLLQSDHHNVHDGRSFRTLVEELGELYAAAEQGRAPRLDQPAARYGEFCDRENDWLNGAQFAQSLDALRDRLLPIRDELGLFAGRRRTHPRRFEGHTVLVDIPAGQAGALKRAASALGVSRFTILLAVFGVVCSRYEGRSAFSIGTPFANRTLPGHERTVGMFANMLPVPVRVRPDEAVASFVQRLGVELGIFRAHAGVPLSRLVRSLGLTDALRGESPFNASFSMHDGGPVDVQFGRLRTAVEPTFFDDSSKFDLSIVAYQRNSRPGSTMQLLFECDVDVFDHPLLEQIARDFQAVLHLLLADPGQQVRALNKAFGAGAVPQAGSNPPLPRDGRCSTVHALIAGQARKTPEAPAVVCADVSLSYEALESRAETIAAWLAGRGIGPGSIVGLCVPRSVDTVAALLGILKAGAAYLPLDESYPAQRLRYMVEDSAASLVLTSSLLPENPFGREVELVRVDQLAARGAGQGEGGAQASLLPGRAQPLLAYVIYTSGSTGKPKGVMVRHDSVVNLLLSMQERLAVSAGDRLGAVTPISFDIAGLELLLPLVSGACVHVLRRSVATDARQLYAYLAERRITVLQMTPSMWRVALDAFQPLPGLRALCGGEMMDDALAARLRSLAGEAWNVYGPTETTIWSTAKRLGPGSVTAGLPIAGTYVLVLDDEMVAVPAGVAGEVFIGGIGVADGYLRRAKLTSERFVVHPLWPGERLYRTGDRGMLDRNGELTVLGRSDQQVKVRGHRIELGEVEAALAADPHVAAAAVLAVRLDDAHELAAYVVPRGGAGPDTARLRAALAQRLPAHMVPTRVTWLDELPLTPSGKVDRSALPAPAANAVGTAYHSPSSPEERLVQEVWAEVFGTPRIGIHDNFFDLGGHSLLAMRILSKLGPFLTAAPGVTLLFNAPSVAQLAKHVRAVAGTPREIPAAATPQTEHGLSHQQEMLWMASLDGSGAAAYNVPLLLVFDAAIEAPAVQSALDRIARAHPVLRSRLLDNPVARWAVEPASDWPLEQAECGPAVQGATALRPLGAEAELLERPFDLGRQAPCRALLTWVGSRSSRLLLVFHHIAVDGLSLQVILDELASHLGGAPAAQMPDDYAPFVRWQEQFLRSPQCQVSVDYWKTTLAGAAPVLQLPADGERVPDARAGTCAKRLPSAVAAGLRQACRSHGVSPHIAVMSALYVVLARWTGSDDLVLGMPAAGRPDERFERSVGMFVNIVPVRIGADPQMRLADMLQLVKRQVLSALDHAALPFDKIVEAAAPARVNGIAPLVQVLVNSLPGLDTGKLAGRASGQAAVLENPFAKYDLTLYVREVGNGFEFSAAYAQPLLRRETADALLSQLVEVLQQLCAAPDLPLAHAQLRRTSHGTPAAPVPAGPRDHASIPQRLAHWAAASPEAVAVSDARQTLTFLQLARRSRAAARRIQAAAGPRERPVALHVERSAMLPVGMLAAILAGRSFVVLDPAYPALRLAKCIEQARVGAVLAEDGLPPELSRLVAAGAQDPPAVVLLRGEEEEGDDPPLEEDAPQAGAPPGCYLIQTSGTTGDPKLVMSPLSAVTAFLEWHVREFGLDGNARFAMLSGLSHDPLMRDVFAPLWVGAQLHVPTREDMVSGRLGTWLHERRISVIHATPSVVASVTAAGGPVLSTLRNVFFGGEKLRRRDVESLFERAPFAQAVNFYGATETPQAVSFHRIERTGEPGPQAIPIGQGTPLATLHVVDALGRATAAKELGEVVVLTPHLSLGYLNDPELTAAKFQVTPAGGESRFHTGDLARRNPDGGIVVDRRADSQVKLRGLRIEPGDVEAALAADPAIARSAVELRQDADGNSELVAHVVRRSDSQLPGQGAMDLSLFFFADGAHGGDEDIYRLYLEAARIADRGGLTAVWTPERHFTDVAAAYPNPAVLSAALATVTERLQLRSGSVVLPLHHPVRVAEEWAVVDNLSKGRVGLSFASGWVPDDFVFNPGAYQDRQKNLLQGIDQVRALLRGEALELENGVGRTTRVRALPRPVQKEIPVWLTAVGNPATIDAAGQRGLNLLTSMTTQSPERLRASVQRYRQALAGAGIDPASRTVTVMLHTFVGTTDEEATRIAGAALTTYFANHTQLRRQVLDDTGLPLEADAAEQAALVDAAVRRVIEHRALVGSVETCRRRIREMLALGVDELACLVDFGIDRENTLAGIERLTALRDTQPLGIDEPALRERLSARLPSYMVPSKFLQWPALPLTPNGKVDMRALARSELAAQAAAPGAVVGPRNEMERKVHGIWGELLGVKELDVRADFFSAGGYSLLIPRLMRLIRDRFDLDLALQDFLRHPTIEGLARHLGGPGAVRDGGGAARRTPRPESSVVRLSAGHTAPLVLVHPVGGGLSCYQELVVELGPEIAAYGIVSLLGEAVGGQVLTDLAARHADDLEQCFAGESIHLCGWSFGGVLAHEIAWQMRERGRTGIEVTLIDAFPVTATLNLDDGELRRRFDAYRRGQPGGVAGAAPAAGSGEYETFVRNHRALQNYRPRGSDTWHTLFYAARDEATVFQRMGGWTGARSAGSQLVEMDTDHHGILSGAHMRRIAEYLKRKHGAGR